MFEVFVDGSSSRKKGLIGTSYIIFKNRELIPIKEFNKGFIDIQARNGIAELLGVYYFLYDLCTDNLDCMREIYNQDIIIYSDSQYVVNELTIWFKYQMIKNFFEIKNKEIILYILFMLYILRKDWRLNIKLKWVRGHQKGEIFEIYGNNLADKRAFEARNENFLEEDIENLIKRIKGCVESEEILKFVKKAYSEI